MPREQYKKIVVAVDGSHASLKAFKKAIEVAKRNAGDLVIAHVVDTKTISTAETYDQSMINRSESYASKLLSDYKDEALHAGVKNVETHIDYGSPKVRIPKYVAKMFHADLIMCGATGLNAVERFLIGSVSENIVRYAPCDVLVVRSHEDEKEEKES
ncbi:Nucleotide-binding universal stress protein, UspA family [Pelagirhabdus alkalitolerans]|uniref:Universal stress protein n=1 Tax=Pelagirhabdus alkalitolerans TaxID=1612202 RepID=A0A1G6HLT5_9BACI|nr:Nucleotide-binding universal stress protein, UspA family [Pelagirhabdus alkalitolerans]